MEWSNHSPYLFGQSLNIFDPKDRASISSWQVVVYSWGGRNMLIENSNAITPPINKISLPRSLLVGLYPNYPKRTPTPKEEIGPSNNSMVLSFFLRLPQKESLGALLAIRGRAS